MFIKNGLHCIIAPEFSEFSPWIRAIKDHFPKNTEVIHEVRNIIKNFDLGDSRITVKAFKVPNCINRFVYAYIRSSKAKRSYENAHLLLARGIKTPKPIAWLEFYECGLLKESYYISLYENFEVTLHGYPIYTKEEQEKLVQEFVQYTVNSLHKNNIWHLDFSPGNILISRDEHKNFIFSLIDLNRMKETPMNFSKGLNNLAKLRPEHFPSIAKEYARMHNMHTIEEQEKTLAQLEWAYKKAMFLPACRKIARAMLKKLFFWQKP